MSLWQTYDIMRPGESVKNLMPAHVAGVYAIYYDGALVYIGSSVDLRNRFCLHNFRHSYAKDVHTPWDDISSHTHVTVKIKRSRRLGDFLMWEMRLIQRLRPRFNRKHIGRRIKGAA